MEVASIFSMGTHTFASSVQLSVAGKETFRFSDCIFGTVWALVWNTVPEQNVWNTREVFVDRNKVKKSNQKTPESLDHPDQVM